MTLTMRKGDLYPPIELVISDAFGPIDLTGAGWVEMNFTDVDSAHTVSRSAKVIDALHGHIQYNWEAPIAGGSYEMELTVHWGSARQYIYAGRLQIDTDFITDAVWMDPALKAEVCEEVTQLLLHCPLTPDRLAEVIERTEPEVEYVCELMNFLREDGVWYIPEEHPLSM